MVKEQKAKTADLRIFQFILFLLLISFFEESQFSMIATTALLAMLFLPIVILVWFLHFQERFTKTDKTIIVAFAVYLLIQIACIRWDNLYTSITPIYRSITVIAVILYIRHFQWNVKKIQSFSILTFITFLIGILTIFFPNEVGANVLFGNYNTVGALFFTLSLIHLIIFLKTRRAIHILLFFGCLLMIILSNTRTALLLLLITFGLYILFKILPKNIIKPKIVLPLSIILLIGFVWFYYNIKSLSIYTTLNNLSKALFDKNFDSGRPDLWHMAVEAVDNKWLFGCGTGIDLENFYPWTKTPHSVYFDIYLQNGCIGVLSFLICILVVIKGKGKWYRSNLNLFFMAIVFVILFYNALGIVFTKSRSGIGLLQWALVALPYILQSEKMKLKELNNDKLNSSCLQC